MVVSSPAVTVIMPVLNEESHLEASVQSILDQAYPGELEIILALGPSHDSTNEVAAVLAARVPTLRFIDNPLGLTTVGLNAAIKLAKHDYIVRVDAHSELAPGYIFDGIRILLEQGADQLGGIMDAKGKSSFQKAVAWAYKSRFGIGGASYHVGGEAGEAESAYLGIFQKSALERVGGYDETIVRGEDWDLAQRIKKTGGLVWFSPELKVTYWPRGTWSKLSKQFLSTGIWRGDLTRRNASGASLRYWIPPVLVGAVAYGLVLVSLGHYFGILPAAGYLMGVAALASTAKGLSLKSRVALVIVLLTAWLTHLLGLSPALGAFLAGMLLGILAASAAKNADIGGAAIAGGQALAVQNQLNFSRDMEREADRVGFGVMRDAGFEGRGFVGMFERLQQSARLNDDGGFPYLRSHPLTTERMADMRARLPMHDHASHRGQPHADADLDGLPDAWERKNGLNPADPTDAVKDRDKDGYSNIEEYLNSLVDVTTVAPVQPKKK